MPTTMAIRSLATGAGLEPAPPAFTGALTDGLPRIPSSIPSTTGNLDMSHAVVHFGDSSMSHAVVHTAPPPATFGMSHRVVRGVPRRGTGFCFFDLLWRGV